MPDYFTLPELRALPQMSDTTLYPDARVESAAAHIVGIIERTVGTAFVERQVTEIHMASRVLVTVERPYCRTLVSAMVEGVIVTDATLNVWGQLTRTSGAIFPDGMLEVTYVAGYTTEPPDDIREAALRATRWHLLETDSNAVNAARVTQLTNEMGGTTTFAVAGSERPTGYPAADAVIIGWRDRLRMPGFA